MYDVTEDLRKDRIKEMLVESMRTCNYVHDAHSDRLQFHTDNELVSVPVENVKVTKKTGRSQDIAHCYHAEHPSRIILGIYPKNWNTLSTPEKFVTIGHELTHLRYTSHQPRFWNEMIRNIIQMLDERDYLNQYFTPENSNVRPSRSLAIFEVLTETKKDICRNCQDQTSMTEDEISSVLDIFEDRFVEYFDWNPVLRKEWIRQKERSDYR